MFNKHPMPWKLWRPWTDELILLDSIIPNYIFIFKKWTSLCWLLSIGEKCRNNSAAMDNLTTGAHLIMNWVCKTRNGTSWPSSVASWNWVTRSWRGGRKSNGEKKISWSARGFCRINQSNLFHEPKSKAKVSQPGGAGLSGCRGVRSAQPAAARSWTSIPLRPGRERERERDSRSAHRAAVVGGGRNAAGGGGGADARGNRGRWSRRAPHARRASARPAEARGHLSPEWCRRAVFRREGSRRRGDLPPPCFVEERERGERGTAQSGPYDIDLTVSDGDTSCIETQFRALFWNEGFSWEIYRVYIAIYVLYNSCTVRYIQP